MAMHRFFQLNQKLARRITPPHVHEANVFGTYWKIGAMLLSHPNVRKVVDVGAGKKWNFPGHYKAWYGIELIGIDIDADEMMPNQLLDQKIVCDAVEEIPLPPNSVDLVMINSGIEHFANNEKFLQNAYSILRPGGYLLAQFPGRFSPFAIINRMLPQRISRKLLDKFTDSPGELGFKAIYDRTNYSSFKQIISNTGFKEAYYVPGFYSSYYFEFFMPFYLISYLYDSARFSLGARNLASYNLWVLQKPGESEDCEANFRFYAWS
jgi:SAM-dependent methyltransferase